MLCDAWGVIHNGVKLFPGAGEAMARFRETRGPITILTNAPRPASIIPPQLDRLGLPRSAYDAVVTSGDSTCAEIERFLPSPAFRIGPEKDDPLFAGMAIEFAPAGEAAFIICTGLVDDQSETPEGYRPLLEDLAGRDLPMICANPDIVVNWGGRMIWCAGALAEIYEQLGGKVIYGGKPYAPIYVARGQATNKARVLVVGDGLATDIAGANNAGVDALLIAGVGGIHDGPASAQAIAAKLKEAGVHVIAAMEALKW